jgi:hypothetical protein
MADSFIEVLDGNGVLVKMDTDVVATEHTPKHIVTSLPTLPAGANHIGEVDAIVVGTVTVADGGGSLTVDGTVAATQSGTWVLGANSDVDIGDVTVNNAAGASAVNIQDGGNSITVDGPLTDAQLRATPVPVSDGAGSLTVDGSVSLAAAIPAGTNNIGDVDVLSLPALPAGTNNIGDVDVLTLPALPAGTNNIGDVDVLTLPALPAGTNNIGDVDIASAPTGASAIQVQGTAAHDAAAVGNPVLNGAQMETMADSAPGTRSNADGDATKLATTDGALYVVPTGPQLWSYHSNGSAALTDATVHAAPGAGLSLYVQTVVFSSGAATAINAFFEEGSTTVLGPFYLEAVAGRGVVVNFLAPKKITANTALTVTTSAAIAHSVDVTGFIAPG